jgi:3-phenylpropionate/cinnamic acid dioxygenase small subunit
MQTADGNQLERLEAISNIQEVLYRIARCVDRRDWVGLQKLADEDCVFDYGAYRGGFSGLAEWLLVRHKHISRSSHLIGNIIVEFASSDVALVESYITSSQRSADPDNTEALSDVITYARYIDRFERQNGCWRIKKRTLLIDNTRRYAVSPEADVVGPGLPMGRRDMDDVLWKERAAVGIWEPGCGEAPKI